MKRQAFKPSFAYVPVDEMLAKPRTRILLALRHLDEVTSRDLFDILDVAPPSETTERDRYQHRLIDLVHEGLVLRRRIEPTGHHAAKHGIYLFRLAPDVDLTIPAPNLEAYAEQSRRDRRKPTRWVQKWRERRAS